MFTQALLAAFFILGSYAQFSSSSSPLGNSASSTSSTVAAQTTMNLFLGASPNEGFVGSVVAADACDTTYALACTSGDYSVPGYGQTSCNPEHTVSVTYRPGALEVYSSIETDGGVGTVLLTCSLVGTVSAVCAETLSASVEGQHTEVAATATLKNVAQYQVQVPITAGADKLSGLASCTSTGNAAAAATGAVDIYKVLIVPGAAALLAGANALA